MWWCILLNFAVSVLISHAGQAMALPIKLGVVDPASREAFEGKIGTIIKQEWASCATCELVNETPYTAEGNYDSASLVTKLQAAMGQVQILFLTWNERANDKSAATVEALKKLSASGILVVAPAGLATEGVPTVQLSKTLVGQVPEAVIIGELTARERLLPASFFGPEMLTAIKPPRQYPEAPGISPLLFSARLTRNWERRGTSQGWLEFFKEKKSKSRKIWLALEDFFPR